ncbi:MAG: uroporphyrinogen decarboxylase family protein [Chloroflexi bacterium]|nr:uroporphyrinogen decarboxylase family protein [Chloroflexota bacterium]
MFKPSPDFRRFAAALRCRQPDRVPLGELWIDQAVMEAFLGRPVGSHDTGEGYDLQAEIEFWYRAGYDYIHIEPRYFFPKKSGRNPSPDEHAGLITSWQDFHSYPWPSLDQVDFSSLEAAPSMLPDGMGIIAGTSGIFEDAWMIMGFETFCTALYDQPDLVAAVFQKVGSMIVEIFRRAANSPRVGAMWISDDLAYTSGPMLAPKVFRRWLYPWYRQLKTISQKRSLPLLFHSDGNLWPLIEDLQEIGFDALQPVEPKAMDIREAKSRLQGKVCLIGNVGLDFPLTRGTPSDVEAAVRELIRVVAPGGGYCLGSSNTIPFYVPLENFVAMNEACIRYGKYV